MILVVDDDRSVRASMLRLLRAHGYTAIDAAGAAEAIQKAEQRSPALILMDLHLHQGSGLDAARQLKAHPTLARIPIIAVTATPPTWDDQLRLFAAVLDKPCPAKELLDAIDAALRS